MVSYFSDLGIYRWNKGFSLRLDEIVEHLGALTCAHTNMSINVHVRAFVMLLEPKLPTLLGTMAQVMVVGTQETGSGMSLKDRGPSCFQCSGEGRVS